MRALIGHGTKYVNDTKKLMSTLIPSTVTGLEKIPPSDGLVTVTLCRFTSIEFPSNGNGQQMSDQSPRGDYLNSSTLP